MSAQDSVQNPIEVEASLNAESTESLAYLAYIKPQTQTEAVRWIFRNRECKNLGPMIRAKRRLHEANYVHEELLFDKIARRSRIVIKSNPKPFISYAAMRLSTGRSKKATKRSLSQLEQRILYSILDSSWFRDILASDLDFDRFWLVDFGRIRASSAMRTMAETVEEVFAFSCMLGMPFYARHLTPRLTDFPLTKQFEEFAEEWYREKLSREPSLLEKNPQLKKVLIDKILWYGHMQEKMRPNGEIEGIPTSLPDERLHAMTRSILQPPYHHLAIPWELSQKMIVVGRVPLTVALELQAALREVGLA